MVAAALGALAVGALWAWTLRRQACAGAGAEVAPTSPDGDVGVAQLREHVERAWGELSGVVDRILGSGRKLDREVLLNLARFLEAAGPVVEAYEGLVAFALGDADTPGATVTALPRAVER